MQNPGPGGWGFLFESDRQDSSRIASDVDLQFDGRGSRMISFTRERRISPALSRVALVSSRDLFAWNVACGLPGDPLQFGKVDYRAVAEVDVAGGILGQGDDVAYRVGRTDRA